MIEKSPLTLSETIESLNGFDEIGIEQRFGADIETLLDTSGVKGTRALAYIVAARAFLADEVQNPNEKAYRGVMGLTLKDVGAFFPDEPDEDQGDDEADPASAVGKDATPLDAKPKTKPSGA